MFSVLFLIVGILWKKIHKKKRKKKESVFFCVLDLLEFREMK
jgi:hypothetical protein